MPKVDVAPSWTRLEREVVKATDKRVLRNVKQALQQLQREVREDTAELQQKRYDLIIPTQRLFLPKKWTAITLEQPMDFYKVVAADHRNKLVSVFDGETRYNLGHQMSAKRGVASWAPLESCYFVYTSKEQAIRAPFPQRAKMRTCPRVLIHVQGFGRGYQSGDKFAFPHLHFVTVLTDALNIKIIQKFSKGIPLIDGVPGTRPS
mmetsp:Transcript_16565/g.31948  ORF Transcript_16565/g.31948 Transcript_16565/m.31948 type:complete len:205 (-) Transcript_16565:513-1127(-)